MTITEIAVDLIRERDQLRERIRELEKMNAELRRVLVDDIAAQRISKAREILPDVDNDIVREALWNALEGK